MAIPRLRTTVFWLALALDVVLLLALGALWRSQPKRGEDPPAPMPVAAKSDQSPAEPKIRVELFRWSATIWFRVWDDTTRKPVQFAHVAIKNFNFADDLGLYDTGIGDGG
jgi:hypothetical protein